MGPMASQITSLTIVYSAVCSGADKRTHQSSASLVFVRGIHRGPVNSPHKWDERRKCFHFMMSSRVLELQGHCYVQIMIRMCHRLPGACAIISTFSSKQRGIWKSDKYPNNSIYHEYRVKSPVVIVGSAIIVKSPGLFYGIRCLHMMYVGLTRGWVCGGLIPSTPSAAYASMNRVSIGPDNGLSPIRHKAIIWTNAGLLSIGTWAQTPMKF